MFSGGGNYPVRERRLPNNVERLLDRHIFSVSQLETLLFLRRHPDLWWTPRQVANELQTNDAAAFKMLSSLSSTGLLLENSGKPTRFKYNIPPDSSDEADMEELERIYREKRLRVIDQIYKKSSVFQEMSDSFRLRNEN